MVVKGSNEITTENNKRENVEPREDGINNNTFKLLFEDKENLPKEERGTHENAIAFDTIDLFTKLQEKRIFTKLLKMIYKHKGIDLDNIRFNRKTKQFEYRNGDKIITFDKLSNHFEDNKVKKELMSNKRYGKCHSKSITIAPYIKKSKIVTGYITLENTKILHSVIEYDEKNKTMVLDWTRNLYISKEQYVELTKFVELSSFDGAKVIDDMKKLIGNLDLGVKPYVVFRDELMKDMERNPHIFKPLSGEKVNYEKDDER